MQIIGIIISIIAFLIILFLELYPNNIQKYKGVCSLFLAIFFHANIYIFSKKKIKEISILTFNTLPSLFTGIFLLIISYYFEKPIISNFSLKSILATIYLGNFIGIFGILSYFYLQKKINSLYTSIIFLFFPFIVGIIDKFLYGYIFSITKIFLLIFLIFGIILIMFTKKFIKFFKYYYN